MPTIQFSFNETLVSLRRETAPGATWDSKAKSWEMTAAEAETFLSAARALPVTDRAGFYVTVDKLADRLGMEANGGEATPVDQQLAYDIKRAKSVAEHYLKNTWAAESNLKTDQNARYFRNAVATSESVIAAATEFDEFVVDSKIKGRPIVIMIGEEFGNNRVWDVSAHVKAPGAPGPVGRRYTVQIPRLADRHLVIAYRDGMNIKTRVVAPHVAA